jgi:hypothetical protein
MKAFLLYVFSYVLALQSHPHISSRLHSHLRHSKPTPAYNAFDFRIQLLPAPPIRDAHHQNTNPDSFSLLPLSSARLSKMPYYCTICPGICLYSFDTYVQRLDPPQDPPRPTPPNMVLWRALHLLTALHAPTTSIPSPTSSPLNLPFPLLLPLLAAHTPPQRALPLHHHLLHHHRRLPLRTHRRSAEPEVVVWVLRPGRGGERGRGAGVGSRSLWAHGGVLFGDGRQSQGLD